MYRRDAAFDLYRAKGDDVSKKIMVTTTVQHIMSSWGSGKLSGSGALEMAKTLFDKDCVIDATLTGGLTTRTQKPRPP